MRLSADVRAIRPRRISGQGWVKMGQGNPVPDVMTTEEVAEMLKVSKRRVLDSPIPQVRLGRRTIRYLREDVYNYLKRKRFDAA